MARTTPHLVEEADPATDAGAGDPPSGGGSNGDIRERLARLEERVRSIKEHMAEKNDITSLKVWILSGVLGAIGVGAAVSTLVVKAFFSGN